ncbi:MAG: AAA family ATPase [Pyrobaculum sp.]|jgi:predicted ATPase
MARLEPQTTVKTGKNITVRLKNFGPFDDVDIELRPLTIFIGKNSVGKSLLLSLLWALVSTRPEIPSDEEIRMKWNKLYEKAESISLKITKVIEPVVSDSGILIEEVSKLIKSMATDVRDFTRTCRDLFKRAMEAGLEVRLRQVFGVSPRELVKVGETSAQIDIKGACGNLHITLTDSVAVDRLDLCIDNATEDEFLSIIEPLVIYIAFNIYIREELKKQFTAYDYIIETMIFLTRKIIDEYGVLSLPISGKFGSANKNYLINMSIREPVFEVFLPGSRACIVHALPRPETFTAGPRDKMSVSDREFIDVYARLIDEYRRSRKLTESENLLLRDMGIELDIATKWGKPVVYVKTWSGKRLELAHAPSGIREVIMVIFALSSEDFRFVFIEEPETHLHPSAQRLLARAVAEAVNNGKFVALTTHSDYLISEFNNLIALSNVSKDVIKKLSYRDAEVLKPEAVAAYLVKAEGNRAVVERLEVDFTGIPEDEFARVAEEILEIRNELY